MLKRSISVVLCIVAATMSVYATGAKDVEADDGTSFRIGYSQFLGTNPFLIAMTDGAKQALGEWEEKGYDIELIVTDAGDTDPYQQFADLEDIYAMDVDGLLIFPAGGSELLSDPVRNMYNKNNIPVVVTDIGLADAEWESFIITDNYMGGVELAKILAENIPAGGKVVTFDANPAAENVIARVKGFEDTAAELGLTVLPEKTLQLTLEDGRRLMEDTMAAVPDLAGVFFINQLNAQGAVAALEGIGNTTIKLVAFDVDYPSLQMVKNGQILALAVQNPYDIGYQGMNQIMTVLSGGTASDSVDIPPKFLTAANASDFDNDPQVNQ